MYKSIFWLSLLLALPAQSAANFSQVFAESQGLIRQYFEEKMPDELRLKLLQYLVEKEDWQAVNYLIRPLARKGDTNSQVNLALMYINGWGVPQSFDKAYWWLSEAAEKGSLKGLNNLALLYWRGEGVQQNIPHAIKLLEKSAAHNSLNAIKLLGRIYQSDMKDDKQAFHWISKASESGDQESTYRLALMYENGVGTALNVAKAVALYQKLIDSNSTFAPQARQRLTQLEHK